MLNRYDLYYVDKEEQLRLPVVKIEFDNPDHTVFYIDLYDGTIAKRYDASARLNRWLYRFLHCLDIPFLLRHRILRDVLMLFFLCGGIFLVTTGFYSWMQTHRRKQRNR
jgi:uncharacterized iron-regulated membrane protein